MEQLSNNAISDYLVSFGTHAGMVGKNNEDFVAFAAFDAGGGDDDHQLVFHLGIVADGVGGQTAGELASRLATQTIINYFGSLESLTIEDVGEHFEKAITTANQAVLDETDVHPEFKGMATTIAMVGLLDGLLFTSHIGDSRIYLYRDSHLHQLSNDHSWVQEALQAGIITEDEARSHPNRNIIRRSLGTMQTVEADLMMLSGEGYHFWQGMPLRNEDYILLCSDGLSDMISDYDIKLSIEEGPEDVADMVMDLIDKANQAGGRDNITVMMFRPAPEFKPNRMMPIPPPSPTIAGGYKRGPQSEQITLVGGSIKRNSNAPITLRSIPQVNRTMFDTQPENQIAPSERAETVKMVAQPNFVSDEKTIVQKSVQRNSYAPARLSDGESPKAIDQPPSKKGKPKTKMAPLYRWMMRIVMSLALIALALTITMFVYAR